jgi:hypothetical protein
MAGELQDNHAEARSIAPKGADSMSFAVTNSDMAIFQAGYTKTSGAAVADRELELFGNGFSFDKTSNPYGSNDVIAQGWSLPNPREWYKNEVEHKYRGKEPATMDKEITAKAWADAYKAFPELKQLGEKDATRLMKAIIANELDHYGVEDVGQDAGAASGHGGGLHKYSLGFAQISPDGVRDMAKQLDAEVKAHHLTSNPLARFEKMNNDQLAKELVNPANAPLLVAAHMHLDLQTLNRHKNEVTVNLEALGYFYNADMVYAASDKNHENLMTKNDAKAKHIPFSPSLPTDEALQRSEHAANIRKWLEKVQ